MKIQSTKDLEDIKQAYRTNLYRPDFTKVNIGMAMCGIANGAQASFQKATEAFSGKNGVRIHQTGCIGLCEVEPLVEIFESGKPRVVYKHMTQDKILEAIQGYRDGDFKKEWILGQIRDPRSLLDDDMDNPMADVTPLVGVPFLEDLPFYNKQVRIVTRNSGYIDPDSIEEYIAKKGYSAFFLCTQ